MQNYPIGQRNSVNGREIAYICSAITVHVREMDSGLTSLFPDSTDELELGWVACTIERNIWNAVLKYQHGSCEGSITSDLHHGDI